MTGKHFFTFSTVIERDEKDFEVDVSGCIYPGEKKTFDYPGSDDYCEIHSVILDGVDIMDKITPEEMETFEEAGFDRRRESAMAAMEMRYDVLMDERRGS